MKLFIIILSILLILTTISTTFAAPEEINELRVKVFVEILDDPSLLVKATFENVPGTTRVVECFYTKQDEGDIFSISPEIETKEWNYNSSGIYAITYWCIDEEEVIKSATSEEFTIGFKSQGTYIDPETESAISSSSSSKIIIKTQPDTAEKVAKSLSEDELKITKIQPNKDIILGILTKKGLEKIKQDPNVLSIIKDKSQDASSKFPSPTIFGVVFGAIVGALLGIYFQRKNKHKIIPKKITKAKNKSKKISKKLKRKKK